MRNFLGDTARAMSHESVEVVRTALAALDRRDVERYLSVASDEIELINPASPLEGSTVGHEGVRRFFIFLDRDAALTAAGLSE
jgi:ketosteroid isomerase-like protein